MDLLNKNGKISETLENPVLNHAANELGQKRDLNFHVFWYDIFISQCLRRKVSPHLYVLIKLKMPRYSRWNMNNHMLDEEKTKSILLLFQSLVLLYTKKQCMVLLLYPVIITHRDVFSVCFNFSKEVKTINVVGGIRELN